MQIEYLKLALNLQGIPVEDKYTDLIITTYKAIEKKQGNFNLEDAVKIKTAIDLKYTDVSIMPEEIDFKQLRINKGLSLREVENITGISNSYLSQLERGKIKTPSYKTVRTLYLLYYD